MTINGSGKNVNHGAERIPNTSDAYLPDLDILSPGARLATAFVRYESGTKKGKPIPGEHNLSLVLSSLQIELAFNLLTNEAEICIDNEWQLLNDAIHDRIYLMLQSDYGFKIPATDCFKMLEKKAREWSYHPILSWLTGLEWDGVPRAYEWLHIYGGAENNAYTCEAGLLMLVAAVRRLLQPGYKFDQMLVLEGPEGCGKSSAIRILSNEWFTDSVPIHLPDPKYAIEAMHGAWIAECAELSGIKKAEVEIVKAFLSRQIDRGRPPYGRKTLAVPRQWVIFGSTNEKEYLASDTGNRRFWPVTVTGFNLVKLLQDRDQLWAEVVHIERTYDALMLSSVAEEAALAEQQKREIVDEWEARIRDWIKQNVPQNSRGKTRVRMGQIAVEATGTLISRLDMHAQKRIAKNLRKIGFKKIKSDGNFIWEFDGSL